MDGRKERRMETAEKEEAMVERGETGREGGGDKG